MSEKYPGGFVTYNPPTPSQTSATGIWTLSQQEQYQQAGLWPNSPSQVSRSLRFNQADSTSLSRTPTVSGNLKTWTWSAWVKRTNLSDYQYSLFGATVTSANYDEFRFNTSDQFRFFIVSSSSVVLDLITTQVFRDPSAWYHFVVAYDSTQATSSNRAKLYVNGVQVTSFATATYPSQNQNTTINSNALTRIGLSQSGFLLNAYMANVQFVDGQALDPTSFGEYNVNTGVWQPLQKNLTYGTNGFQLTFNDNTNTTATTLGADSSGNGNNFTPSNFSVTAGAGNDSLVDSPTSYGTDTGVGGTVRGNYATWNAVLQTLGGTASTYTNGNLVASSTNSNWVLGTIRINDAKYYFELVPDSAASGLYLGINSTTDVRVAAYSGGIEASPAGGSNQGSLASWSNGDVIGVAVDGPNKTVQFYRNGSTYGTLVTYTTALDLWAFARNGGAGSSQVTANFGQRPFAYTAPSGYKALCTQNLPTPTIGATTATQAGKYFNPVLYTGNGTTQAVTGVGFQPDFTWVKNRSAGNSNGLEDVIRGAGYTLASNETSIENNYSAYFTAFTSDGFNMALGGGTFNNNGSNYVAWNWKANGSGSTNTAGSITSTVSANTTSGFSVVTYTATGSVATIGHGLGVAPKMVILKGRSGATDWFVYHSATGANVGLYLNQTLAGITSANFWNNTAPTSTVFTAGTGVGGSGVTMVAYCFAEVAGYSKFGSYTGNGSSDGPFVYTGMRPAYILVKCSSAAENWAIYDVARDTYNVVYRELYPNSSAAETSGLTRDPPLSFDFLSNGFKLRGTNPQVNGNGNTYIFAAFAQNPFKYSLAR